MEEKTNRMTPPDTCVRIDTHTLRYTVFQALRREQEMVFPAGAEVHRPDERAEKSKGSTPQRGGPSAPRPLITMLNPRAPVAGGASSKAGVACTSLPTPGLIGGERCWEASFTLPANSATTARTHTITVRSSQISSVPSAQVSVEAADTKEETTPEDPAPASTATEAVVAALSPLGSNLQWVLYFNNVEQQWFYYAPDATPSRGTLADLVPGQVYRLGLDEDQTVVRGGVSRTLKAGLNQLVW